MRRLEQGLVSRRPRGGEAGWASARALLRSCGLVAVGYPELAGRGGWSRRYTVRVKGLGGDDRGLRELTWTGERWTLRKA